MIKARQTGFTLVELAIVLVVIGLILGMAFKGKDLIDGAKVKNMAAQYNKVVTASNTFYEKYGFYPGDGCPAGATTVVACNGAKNGLINGAGEIAGFWALLKSTNILTQADQRSVFGGDWNISNNNVGVAGNGPSTTGNVGNNYLYVGGAVNAQNDVRFICALDKMMDDGVPNTGMIRSSGGYTLAADCWAQTGTATMLVRILP